MASTICKLLTNAEHPDGFSYEVTIETGMRAFARLNVVCLKPDSDDIESGQGVDMSPTECRALAAMLTATAILVENAKAQQEGIH